jgi:phosphate transport system substrate-binding protein
MLVKEMNRRQFIGLVVAGGGAFVLGALANYRSFNGGGLSKDEEFILIVSENSMSELIDTLTKAYSDKNKKVNFRVEKGSSLEAIIAAKLGSIDVAAITRDLSDEEYSAGGLNYLIARSCVSIIVNPANPIESLTSEQVQALFTGKIRTWTEVNGVDAYVNVMSRESGSSTRQYLEEIVLNGQAYARQAREFKDAKSLVDAIAKDVNAIGFVAAKDAKNIATVKRLDINGIPANKATVLSGRYPLSSSFYLLLAGNNVTPKNKGFIDFVLSAAGKKIVEQLIPVC